ncbi:YbaY family lipoprotein [Paraferrimonas haliotis]|uniref:Chaperone for general secretion pathway YbaY n=1 Tax=Paraferrimonas haliotis TaxID=2013866 RepID=A0AA37TRG5_9GAMM|nr:YbaY family lipoprotein [Paraferrimonas haliotis]GLS84323.1 chaperone for general secretion pathway YbaY [Paraferrimonas haliotis]
MTKRLLVLLSFALMLISGCVTVPPEKPIVVSGAAGYLERIALPRDARITIALIDMDTPGVIVDQKTFNVAVTPVPFKFLIERKNINSSSNYGVVAMIESNGRVIFQTYDRYPVINNDVFTAEVIMKQAR